LRQRPSEMHSEKARYYNNHDYYADDVKDVHCFAPSHGFTQPGT